MIDEDGVGGGVVDQLPGTIGFVNNSSPLRTSKPVRKQVRMSSMAESNRVVLNFANLKAQCAFKFAELVETHKLAIKNAEQDEQEMLAEELSTIRQKDPDKDGKLRLVPKEEIKADLGRSPDGADTFIFRMYFEILRQTTSLVPPTHKSLQHSHIRRTVVDTTE